MKDQDIRSYLLRDLRKRHSNVSGTVIIEELGLCQGDARIDIAVINSSIHGWEIKSERDTLYRLPAQATIYNAVLDYVTIITTSKHISKLEAAIPRRIGTGHL